MLVRQGLGMSMKRYEALAQQLTDLIESGVLLPGDRLPSMRKLRAANRVSPGTVREAFRKLEDEGKIQARPRSGHYVSAHWRRAARVPQISLPSRRSVAMNGRDLVFDVIETSLNPDFVPFGSAFPAPEFFPHPKLAQALRVAARNLDPRCIYDRVPLGDDELRRLISQRYLESGCDVPPAQIIITSGALEALNLCLEAVTRPGDLVAIECPAFYLLIQALERLGLKAVEIPTHPRDGMSITALAAALDRHPIRACWVMTSFQNPLGSSMPEENRRELVKLLAARDIPLIEDDVYSELHFGKDGPRPAKALDRGGRVLHCGSFSKSLAPGYRVGWAAPGRHFARIEQAKLLTSIATSVPTQAAIVEFLKHGGYAHHLRKLRSALAANQKQMLGAIARRFPAGTRTTVPLGGYFLWVEMPEKVDAMEVHLRAAEQMVTIAPGPLFSPQRGFRNCIRLNYGFTWSPRLEAGMATLGKIVGSLA